MSKRLTVLSVFLNLTIVNGAAQGQAEFPTPIIVSPLVNAPLANTYGNAVAVSPDGRNIFYIAERSRGRH